MDDGDYRGEGRRESVRDFDEKVKSNAYGIDK